MKNLKILAACMLALLASCSSPKNYKLKIKPVSLEKKQIYNIAAVEDFLFDAEEVGLDSLKEKSRDLFLKGVNAYKNKKDFVKAIALFKSSVLIFPDNKTYYELGNVLLDLKADKETLEEAAKAFEMASSLKFQPEGKVDYKLACVYNLLRMDYASFEDEYSGTTIRYIRDAITMGIIDTNSVKKDPNLNSIVSLEDYRRSVLSIVPTVKTSPIELFKKAFPLQTDRFNILATEVEMNEFRESVSYDFVNYIPEMENTGFGRDVSHDFYYVANLEGNENYSAVIYTSVSFYGEDMQPVHTTLATYDSNGELISRKLISCQCSAENIREAFVEKNSILMKDYKRIWAKPIDEVPFAENRVKDYELVAEAKYTIAADGKIIKDEVPANYSDSTILAVEDKQK